MSPILKINSKRYAVRSAAGNQKIQAVGLAGIVDILSTFTQVVALNGTRLILAASVRHVPINGFGHLACRAGDGLNTSIGTLRMAAKLN